MSLREDEGGRFTAVHRAPLFAWVPYEIWFSGLSKEGRSEKYIFNSADSPSATYPDGFSTRGPGCGPVIKWSVVGARGRIIKFSGVLLSEFCHLLLSCSNAGRARRVTSLLDVYWNIDTNEDCIQFDCKNNCLWVVSPRPTTASTSVIRNQYVFSGKFYCFMFTTPPFYGLSYKTMTTARST